MKKNKIKYILVPAFTSAVLFPIVADNSSIKAADEVTNNTAITSTSSTNEVNNNEANSKKIPMTLVEYKQKSALELAQLIREQKVTSEELVNLAYKAIDEENPKLNAVLTTENGKIPTAIKEEAYTEAKDIDARIKAGNVSANPVNWEEQPFLGVPTLIKGLDQIKNGDASNGVYFNKGKISKSDLAVAREFRKLGFIILGQTNFPELGTRNITDSKLFGPAGNPWDPSRNTGGSSGGSAGAVASGMVSIASGSDAGGSIRIPASWTGLIGLKPTGHIVKFPLVKTIEDAKVFFDKTKISKPKTLIDVPNNLKTLKIGYSLKTPLNDVELSEDGKKAVLKAVDFLKSQGFTVEEVSNFPIDGYEGIKTYTTGAIGGVYSQAAKLANETTKYDLDPATYALGTSTITKGKKAGNTDISEAKPLSEYQNVMNNFYSKYDIFLTATNAVTAPSNDKNIDPYVDPEIEKKLYNINDIKDPKERFNLLVKQWEPMMKRTPFTWLYNLTGNPAISLPVYKSDSNLPLGVMLAAKDNSEKILLEFGQLFQDNNQFVMHPNIRNTATTDKGNKVGVNDYNTKYEYSIPTVAPTQEELPVFTENLDEISVNGNKTFINNNGEIIEYYIPRVAPSQETLPVYYIASNDVINNQQANSNSTSIKNNENEIAQSKKVTDNNNKIKSLPKTGTNTNSSILYSLLTLVIAAYLVKRQRRN